MAQNKITRGWGIIGAAASTEAETTKSVTRSEDLSDELLPGIPNDVALEEIAPKLSVGDVRLLYKASPIWREAIRGHVVYDARVRSHATLECFIFVIYSWRVFRGFHTIIVYSPSDERWYKLPRTPGLRARNIDYCRCVSLNGAIYLLDDYGSPEVSMLDLAGESRWRRCANMLEARICSAVSVMDGKIFVFGGHSYAGRTIRRCEAYDPTVDAWSEIKPMISLGHTLSVVVVGKELFVYGYYFVYGCFYADDADIDPDAEDELLDRDETRRVDDAEKQLVNLNESLAEERLVDLDESLAEERLERLVDLCETLEDTVVDEFCEIGYKAADYLYDMRGADFIEAYDPIKDEWRVAGFWEVSLDAIRLPEQKYLSAVTKGIVWKMFL